MNKQEKNRLIYVLLAGVGFIVLAFLGIFAGNIFFDGASISGNIASSAIKKNRSLSPTLPVQEERGLTEIRVGEVLVDVEIARTRGELRRGLSERDSLQRGTGMLFVFETPGQYSFWMKDMRFPLDIIWIADGKVVGFEESLPVPDPETPDADLPTYQSLQPFTAALEVNAGFVEKNNIKIGSKVEFSSLKPSL